MAKGKNSFTIEELREKGYELNGSRATRKAKKKPKYGNEKTGGKDGKEFDSKKEANFAQTLETLIRIGEVEKYDRQVRYDITINGKYIAFYKLDFLVHYTGGRKEYIDVKPFDIKKNKFLTTPTFMLKKKLVEAIHGIEIILK